MLLTVRETAERLKVSPATVYALVSSGQLACHRIGTGRGTIRISEGNIEAYLQECQFEAAGKPTPPTPRPRLKHIRL